jgi:hypothetical protein
MYERIMPSSLVKYDISPDTFSSAYPGIRDVQTKAKIVRISPPSTDDEAKARRAADEEINMASTANPQLNLSLELHFVSTLIS